MGGRRCRIHAVSHSIVFRGCLYSNSTWLSVVVSLLGGTSPSGSSSFEPTFRVRVVEEDTAMPPPTAAFAPLILMRFIIRESETRFLTKSG